MLDILLAVHIAVAVFVIVLVLVQHGKGADMGAAFGSGSSQTVFGSKGAAPFLMKLTGFLAAIFFATSLGMGYLSKQSVIQQNRLSQPIVPNQQTEYTNQPNTKDKANTGNNKIVPSSSEETIPSIPQK